MENFECLTLQNISKMDINQDFAQKYLEYLVTLMKLNKPIDFIQAALVMQTLSSVFAKKVDHLQEQILAFTIVFRKLELGAQSENDDGSENSDGHERGKAIRKRNVDKDTIMHVFENVCTANNIRKSLIKKWSDKDIKKVDPYSIRNKINECPKMKTKDIFSCYIYDSKLDKLGKKEEFGCNGMLCENLIPKDSFCLSCSHSWNLSSYNETMAMDVEPPAELPNILQDDALRLGENALPSPIANVNDFSYHEVVETYIHESSDKNDSGTDFVYFERINKVQEVLVDVGSMYDIMWSPINDDNKLMERKIKKKNVKMPIDDAKKDESTNQSKMPYPSDYVVADLMLAVFKLKSNIPLHPHFTNSLRLEKEYRSKHINKKNGKKLRNAVTNPKNADFKGFNEFDDDHFDNNDFEHEHDVSNDIIDPAACGVELNNNDNYMQEAIQHIRGFNQGFMQNQNDDTINEIAVKVSAWHDSIRPHLEREEGRTNFDIHEYGSKILQRFPVNNAKTSLTFGDCVPNEARDEIPRYFLSSLLLANSYNVEITKSKPDELSVNDMMLTLLSRVRQHEVLDEGMRKEFS